MARRADLIKEFDLWYTHYNPEEGVVSYRNSEATSSFPMIERDEKRIIERARRGESGAFGLLYDAYQPRIYRFIYVKVGNREEAEDLTHQVFVSAWTNVGRYRDRGFPFSSWLYRIARNEVIDYYRTRKPDIILTEEEEGALPDGKDQDLALEGQFAIEQVTAAIRMLKQEYQDVILMRFVDELTIREVAKVVQKSEGAVKLMQHRAVKALKKQLNAT